MTSDPEISAMGSVAAALDPLEDDARARVISWAADRFGVKVGARKKLQVPNEGDAVDDGDWEDVAAFFAQAAPATDADKALVVSYWFQLVKGESDLDGGKINSELKNLGHGISNITRAFDDLKARKPALAMQTQKSGKSKQARKKYKLTTAGISRVKLLLKGGADTEDNSG